MAQLCSRLCRVSGKAVLKTIPVCDLQIEALELVRGSNFKDVSKSRKKGEN
jgi:hypothetical protein